MQICVITHENQFPFYYHRKRYFYFKVSLDIFNHILQPKILNFQNRTILTAKISKNCKVEKLLKTYLHEMKCLKQVIFDYINEKLSKNYLSKSIVRFFQVELPRYLTLLGWINNIAISRRIDYPWNSNLSFIQPKSAGYLDSFKSRLN